MLFCTLIGNAVVLVTSPLRKFPAAIVFPLTINPSAFSAVPKYFAVPEPVISNVLKLYPGLIRVKPCIVVFGVNALLQ